MKSFLAGVLSTFVLFAFGKGFFYWKECRKEECEKYGILMVKGPHKKEEKSKQCRVWVNGVEQKVVEQEGDPYPGCLEVHNHDGSITLLRNVEIPDWWVPQPGQKAKLEPPFWPWGKRTLLPDGVKLD